MAQYQLSGIGAASSCYNELLSMKTASESAFKALSSAPHQFRLEESLDVKSVGELSRCRRVLGKNVRMSHLPIDTSMYLALAVTLGGKSSLDEDDVRVVLSIASECLLSLRDRLNGNIIPRSSDVNPMGMDIEESGSTLNIGDQEKCLQTLLGCFKFVVKLALDNRDSDEIMSFVGHFFSVIEDLQHSIGNLRKIFSKFIANDVLNCCLESLAKVGEGNEVIESYILKMMKGIFFGSGSIDEMFRVSTQIVNSKEALVTDGGTNPYRKWFICIHSFCHKSSHDTNKGSVKAFGRVFEELLNACLRKSKAAADKHSTYDKKSIQMVVKVCAAFLLQAGVDQRQGIFRNEVLRLVSDMSSTLLTYDASGDLLELYSTLWRDTKARLPKALESSSGELSVEIDCLRNILVVHHRLVLEGEGELDSMCAVALAGDGHDSELVSAQVELVLLLLDLYHRLGRLSEVLVSICRVSRGEGGLVAAPLVGPRRGVLGSEQVQRQLSVSFAELSVLQAAELWKLLAEQSELVSGLEFRLKCAFMACLSLVCKGIVSVVMSRPSSKRVNSSRVTVPVEPTFVMIEACLDVIAEIHGSESANGKSSDLCVDSEALAAILLRVGSLLICQVSSREMEIQREQWQSYISVVLNKWVKARSKNADSPSISSNVSLFSAVIFVYIAQTRCGLKEELKETEALVAGFVQSYEEQISTRAQDYEETERKPSKAKGKGKKRKLDATNAASEAVLPQAGFDFPLVRHADVLGAIFASQECTPLYPALLMECKYLVAPSLEKGTEGVPSGLYVASPVLAKSLQLCLSSSLKRLAGARVLVGGTRPSREICIAVRALKFYREMAPPATETATPLDAAITQTLGGILVNIASEFVPARPNNSEENLASIAPEYCQMAELVAEVLMGEIKRSATVSSFLVSSLGGNEGSIVGLMRFTELVVTESEETRPHLCDICQVLMVAVVEKAVASDDPADSAVVPILCEATLGLTAAVNERHGQLRAQMALTVNEILSAVTSRMSAEAVARAAAAASKALGCSISAEIVSGRVSVALDSYSQALGCLVSSKAMLIQLQLLKGTPETISAAGDLLRHLVEKMAVVPDYDESGDMGRSAEPWLGVLGDLLELHRREGLVLCRETDAVFIFNSLAHWLAHTGNGNSSRSEVSRLRLVRVLVELLVLSRGHSEGLNTAVVRATRTLREYSSDSVDSARALFSSQLVHDGAVDSAAVSAAREVLLEASTKIFGAILSAPDRLIGGSGHGGLGPSLSVALPEEAAFFRFWLSRGSSSKNRKTAEDESFAGNEHQQTDNEASMLAMKAIDTYAILAAQAHALLQQANGAQLALELCLPCLAALQEICTGAAGQLSFCFPLFSTAVARIAHCLLIIGGESPLQNQALGTVRRIMLTVASTKSLARFFALFAAAMIEVLVACNSSGRHGAEPLVSGIFTLADRCNGLGRKSTIMPLLSPAARELFAGLMEKFGAAFKYKG